MVSRASMARTRSWPWRMRRSVDSGSLMGSNKRSVALLGHLNATGIVQMAALSAIGPQCAPTAKAEATCFWVILVSVDPALLPRLQHEVREHEILSLVIRLVFNHCSIRPVTLCHVSSWMRSRYTSSMYGRSCWSFSTSSSIVSRIVSTSKGMFLLRIKYLPDVL